MNGFLGLGGDPAATQAAFNTYLNSTGYQFNRQQGLDAVNQSKASQGLFNSGSTLEALDNYATGEAKAAAWVTKAQANEAKATGAEHTKLAARIAKRISRVQKLETRGNTLLAKIAAKCGGTTGSSSSTGSAT